MFRYSVLRVYNLHCCCSVCPPCEFIPHDVVVVGIGSVVANVVCVCCVVIVGCVVVGVGVIVVVGVNMVGVGVGVVVGGCGCW